MRSITHVQPLRLPADPSKTLSTMKELRQAVQAVVAALKQPDCPFQTVVVDSLNELQEVVMANVISAYNTTRQYDDQPTLADYGKAQRDFMTVFRVLLKLPCHVVFTAVTAPKQYPEDQSTPAFVGKRTGPEVMRLIENVGYCFTKETGERVNYLVSFTNTPDHVGKDRFKLGSKPRPNNFEAIFGTTSSA